MTEPIDLAAIRSRLERALKFVSEAAPDGVRDPKKTRRAAYLLATNDVPALLAEVERLTAELAEARDTIGQMSARWLRTRPVVEAAVAWRGCNPNAFRSAQRLAAAVDAYTAGQVEVPPTPTTDAEIEALPRLDIAEWKATFERLVDLATVTGYLWTDPGTGQKHMLAPEDVAVVVRPAQQAASGRTDPGEGEETHEAPTRVTGALTEWRVQWISRLFGDDREREEGRRDFTDEAEACAWYTAEKARALGPYWRIELRQRGVSPWAAVLSSGYGESDARETPEAAPDAPRGAEAVLPCSRCGSNASANPAGRLPDGTPSIFARFCAECIDRCHESTDFAHVCAVCTANEVTR